MYRYEVDSTTRSDIETRIGKPFFYEDNLKFYVDGYKKDVSIQYYDSITDSFKTENLDEICQALYSLDFSDKSTEHLMEEIQKVKASPFADKQDLFFRGQGIQQTITANSTEDIIYIIPYTKCKINGIEVLYGNNGDTCNFKILDTTTGTYTTIPNYLLNQFGFNWNIKQEGTQKELPYDADLFLNMQVVVEYTNNSNTDTLIGINLNLHEDKS